MCFGAMYSRAFLLTVEKLKGGSIAIYRNSEKYLKSQTLAGALYNWIPCIKVFLMQGPECIKKRECRGKYGFNLLCCHLDLSSSEFFWHL